MSTKSSSDIHVDDVVDELRKRNKRTTFESELKCILYFIQDEYPDAYPDAVARLLPPPEPEIKWVAGSGKWIDLKIGDELAMRNQEQTKIHRYAVVFVKNDDDGLLVIEQISNLSRRSLCKGSFERLFYEHWIREN